jgi:hypothetical protein
MVASPISATTSSGTPREKRIPTSRLAGSLLAVAGLVLALTPAAQAAPIVTPGDGYEGPYRLVFATSSHPMADSSRTMTDFNADVTTAAGLITELAALGTTWTAIASTPTVDARDNSDTNPSSTGIPIYTTSGLRIADDNADLWGGSIQNPIMLDDGTSGGNLTGIPPEQRSYADYTWTGSNTDGTGASSGDGRQLSTDGNLRVSRGGKIDAGWISGVSIGSADSRGARFYGISGVITGGPAAPFAITEIDYAPDADPNPTVTLTWRSRPNTLYRVMRSTDLSDWTNELVDSIGSEQDENTEDGAHITFSFDLVDEGLDSETDLFFRVEEQPPPQPQ